MIQRRLDGAGGRTKVETKIARAMRDVFLETWEEVTEPGRLKRLMRRYGSKYELTIENTVTGETWIVDLLLDEQGNPKLKKERKRDTHSAEVDRRADRGVVYVPPTDAGEGRAVRADPLGGLLPGADHRDQHAAMRGSDGCAAEAP